MKSALLFVAAATLAMFASSLGIRPRTDPTSYAAHSSQPEFSIGAEIVPRQLVKKMFAADLNKAGYVVVEVGLFPAQSKDVDLYPADFRLWLGEGYPVLRPVDSETIAEILGGVRDHDTSRSPRDLNTSLGVGIAHGTYTDPVTGQRRGSTITEAGAGVGVGGAVAMPPCPRMDCDTTPMPPVPQHPSVQNAHAIGQELWQKGLPDGKTSDAVAGYLYFPKPPKKASAGTWELRYEPASGRIRLPLPSKP